MTCEHKGVHSEKQKDGVRVKCLGCDKTTLYSTEVLLERFAMTCFWQDNPTGMFYPLGRRPAPFARWEVIND